MEPLSFVLGCLAGLAGVGLLYFVFMVIHPWIRLKTCGGKGTMPYLVFMRLRGTPVSMVIDAYISLIQSGALVSLREVEAHYVANQGRVTCASDIVDSMSEGPIKTHVAVWLVSEDAQWLADHLSERAEQLSGDDSPDDSGDEPRTSPVAENSQLEVERCDRIAQRANAAVAKAQRVAQR